jgi:hypothetical protein
MIRLTVAAAILAIGTVSFAAQANAQSPNPALLAPAIGTNVGATGVHGAIELRDCGASRRV